MSMPTELTELNQLRDTVSRWMLVLLWLHLPLAALVAWGAGNGIWGPAVAVAVVAAVANAAWWRAPSGKSTRLTIAAAYIAIVSILLAAARGCPLQIDGHMYYFAAMAVLAAYCDRDVILLAAGITAVHHLTLNFLAPALVFPDGANLPRVLLHAGIVVVEAGALVWMTHHVVQLFGNSARHLTAAHDAARDVAAAQAEATAQAAAAAEERQAAEARRAETAAQQTLMVDTLAAALARLAGGDLQQRVNAAFPADYENLRRDFNTTVAQLQQTMTALIGYARGIHSGSEEIVSASDNLARRTEQQAATLTQTTSALQSVTRAVQATATGAARAQSAVSAARGDTERSGAVVAEAVEAMSGIDSSSRQIGNIIGVIDEIAFQTNLLALNAGVEAARAGDAGRGFAVVATEVRALAQRSADAAKEIKTLIQASEAQVQAGVDRVGRTGEVLVRLAAQVGDIDREVTGISAAAQEQAGALAEVAQAVSTMEQLTQHTAAMAEQATAASHGLVREARLLTALSERFDIGAVPEAAMPATPHMRQAKVLAAV